MGAVVQLQQIRQHSEAEKWRQAGYEAVDRMVDQLKDEIEGKDFEELSEMLRAKGRSVTGAILEEVIKSRGASQRAATLHVCAECGRRLTRQRKLHRRQLDSLHGQIEIERPYFYGKHCGRGHYPFDQELGIAPQQKQYD